MSPWWRASVVLALAAGGALGCDGRPRASEGPKTDPPKRHGPAVAVLDLSGGVPEQDAPGLFGVSGPRRSFDELLRVLSEIEKPGDAAAAGVMVRFGSARIGSARAEEIADRLAKVRADKPVHCHAEQLGNLTMMIAAKGCSRITVAPAGEVDAIGIAAQLVYMRRLLADELHLSIDMIQIGKFKGAEEPLTRDGPSAEARASLMGVLGSIRASWLEALASSRANKAADVFEDGPWTPLRAKEIGLVDEVGFFDDALAAARTESKAVRDRVAFGPGADDEGDLDDLVRALAGEGGATGPIALLRATGSISMSGGGGLLGGRGGIVEKEFSKTIGRLERDDDVKAVVLRIDSPGGSALASDLMWHELMKLRKKKPLVVSVGDMAASGGYYLASAGDFIYAEPMSIVGSIGVVGGKIGFGEALERVGVHAETFPASARPGGGARAAYESPLIRWDDATKARVTESMTGIYELFLSRVAEGRTTRGRTIGREKVAESGEGKIFSGKDGHARGLVDELGGLGDALVKARELAKLPKTARVATVSGKGGLLDGLDPGGDGEHAKAPAARVEARFVDPVDVLGRIAPDLVPFVTGLAPLAEGERATLALPYGLTVR